MSYLHPALKVRIIAQIQAKEALLVKAELAYASSLENSEVSGYTLDSGEGKQSTFRRKPAEIRKEIEALTAELDALYRRLSGSGIVSMNLRRRS